MNLSTVSLLKHANPHDVIVDSAKTKQVQKVLLKIIKEFDACCKKHDISYVLCGGCALGAVRHKGFIPWDDDIDVFMTREEYYKFLQVYHTDLVDKYTLHSPETTAALGIPIAQLSLNGTVYRTQLAPSRKNPGIFLDIFVIENVPDNVLIRYLHGFVSLAFGLALSCARYYQDREIVLAYYKNSCDEVLKSLKTKIFLGRILNVFLGVDKWCRLNNWWSSICKNSKSKLVTSPSGRKHYFGEMLPRETLCEAISLPFEDVNLPVMRGYVEYFTNLYGADFMIPPKDADKEVHTIMELDFGEYEDK